MLHAQRFRRRGDVGAGDPDLRVRGGECRELLRQLGVHLPACVRRLGLRDVPLHRGGHLVGLAGEAVEQRPAEGEPERPVVEVTLGSGPGHHAQTTQAVEPCVAVRVRNREGGPISRARDTDLGSGGAGHRLRLPYLRRGLERLGAARGGVGKRRERRIGDSAHRLVHAHLAPEIGLGGGEVGLGLEQRELRVAKVYRSRERVGARRGAGLEFVDRDLALFLGALDLRFGHAHELLVCERGEEELLGGGGDLGPLVDDLGVGGVQRGGRGASVGKASEAIEQVVAQRQRTRVRCVRRHRHDLPRQ